MPESSENQPTAPAPPQTFERRAFIRYPRRLEILWQILGMASKDMTSGEVFDLSTTGVGMILDRSFSNGKVLILRLPTTLGWISHLVRVRHSKPRDDGRFQVGCAFVKPLSGLELESHLIP